MRTHPAHTPSAHAASVRRAPWLALLLLCVALLGFRCDEPPAPRTWLDTPDGFVSVSAHSFAYKAIAPDGAAIGIRARRNDEEGSLAFWLEVFQREMTDGKGYKLSDATPSAQDIQSADGVPGKLLSFDIPDDRVPHRYQLALFVSAEHIVTLETVCESPSCDRHAAAFAAAIKGVRATTDDDPKATPKR